MNVLKKYYGRVSRKLAGAFSALGGRPRSYALNELDLKLLPYLDYRDGVFIEAGANDGLAQSNTRFFEKYRGWTGLLVEPIPELARLCKKNRPRQIVANCALVPEDYPNQHVEMSYCNLMSVVRGGMKSQQEEDEHLRRGSEVQNVETYTVSVPARTLTSLLDEHRIQRIDLLSLDVEGFELSALQGLDLNKYRPRYMLIEARYRQEIDQHLATWYEPIAELTHHDVLYRCIEDT